MTTKYSIRTNKLGNGWMWTIRHIGSLIDIGYHNNREEAKKEALQKVKILQTVGSCPGKY